MNAQVAPAQITVRRTARDPFALLPDLQAWLATQLPDGADPRVSLDHTITTNALTSPAVLCTVIWSNGFNDVVEPIVVRLCPADEDVPLFPDIDVQRQYEVMRVVGELSDVPVPQVRWLEPHGTVLGSPFFCMRRVEGEAPPDLMPYTLGDNWLFEATAEQRDALQEATVEVVAKLHDIPDPVQHFPFLEVDEPGATHLAKHLSRTRRWYEYAAADLGRVTDVERALDWLTQHLPSDPSAVLSWGDARVGNILYHDFTPEAVLDWEMAGLAPRELDLAWLIVSHNVFQELAHQHGLPGMPDFMDADRVAAQYRGFTGHEPRNLDWFRVYAATIWAIVFMRTGWRQVRFGEADPPADPSDILYSLPVLVAELDAVLRP